MDMTEKAGYVMDNELKKTIKYLDRIKNKELEYMHRGKNNSTVYVPSQ